ncbi:hypothetical protein KJS94_06495 [Flavihumibacter rivuli]|uniref:hypothetical protein n=1 Tax=Flavihumibacter rivuli TaxID=2838156 RepID=UPI001BDE9905|nr:hypothetical protein [Flavihumibacter rivuli]ULQ57846.1 hypothetical protein KJS94_06495 [Flavihumibacter rivuli]
MKRSMMALALILSVALTLETKAQSLGSDYRTALGVKFYPGGITVKHFIKDNAALEGIAYFWNHGFRFTGLYEFHGDINGAPGLKWYVGPGAHMGFYNKDWNRNDHYYEDGDFSFGLDGVLGLDYKIKGAPLNLSLDVQPYLELANGTYMDAWGGFAIRFTF